MDQMNVLGNRLLHPSIRVDLQGSPILTRGKIANALAVNGNGQYANFGAQAESCFGDLDKCPHGVLWGAWFRPGQLSDNMEFMSAGSNGLKMDYDNGLLKIQAKTTSRVWDLEIRGLQPDVWNFFEIDWHPVNGLSFYQNNRMIASTNRYEDRDKSDLALKVPDQDNFYLGRGDGSRRGRSYGNFTIDDMEYWYGSRDYLLAFDYLQRGVPWHLVIDMDQIRSGEVLHPSLRLPVYGGARTVLGQVNRALRLNGNAQYLDIVSHSDVCLCNLSRCNHGLTG